ncbi:MAG TPA: hypothetical protein VFF73_15940, partial [Planctomycetota bacterium]|nr:hypothetical protein [Planctomycetota bacterium]
MTFTITSGNGALSTTTATTDASGQAQTTLTLGTAAGTDTVTATATDSNGQPIGSPITFTATGTPAAEAQLAFSAQPSRTLVNVTIQPAVTVVVEDAYGNVVPGATDQVSIALSGGATLAGTTTVSATSGVATFTDLSTAQAATGYTLSATANGLAPATSAPFDVVPTTPYLVSYGNMPTPRTGFAAAGGADGLIYTIGGVSSGTVTGAVEAYAPTTGAWTEEPPLPT